MYNPLSLLLNANIPVKTMGLALGLCALVACAETDDGSDPLEDAGFPATTSDAGTLPPSGYDASSYPGYDSSVVPFDSSTFLPDSGGSTSDSGPVVRTDSGTSTPDAGDPFGGLAGGLGGLLGGGDGGAAKPDAGSQPDSGASGQCKNQVCIDVFDCWIFYGSCNYTACDALVCK